MTVTDDGGAAASGEAIIAVEPYGDLSVSLSGTVRDHATHAPISDASVTVNQYGDGVSHLVGRTDTDANGGYAVQVPVDPGRLTVHAEADGYAAQSGVVNVARTRCDEPRRFTWTWSPSRRRGRLPRSRAWT